MAKRRRIPRETETELLFRSRRRCCLCLGFNHDWSVKQGQIAHLDGDPSHCDLGNLAFLCLPHHEEFDSRTSQSKGITPQEVRRHRDRLYEAIEAKDGAFWLAWLGPGMLDSPEYLTRLVLETAQLLVRDADFVAMIGAQVAGSGAIAQSGSAAAGERGIAVGGYVAGPVITGDASVVAVPEALLAHPVPAYGGPPAYWLGGLPDPGELPQGSRMPFTRNALFTGREEPLLALAAALLHDETGSALVTQAVAGMGGVGKTQLAVEFAYRYGRFFHGVHWIGGAQVEAIGAEVAACGAAMCLPDWPSELPDQISRTLSEWQRSGPRLVILDNFEDVDAVREWLARLGGGPVRVLVTARRTDWPGDLGLQPLPLVVFSPSESRDFLRRHLPEKRAGDEELEALAERLGHLPLALQLAGRYLARVRRLEVAAYLEKLERIWEHPPMRGWRKELGDPVGHDLDLAASFAMSWERVEDESARRLFLLAGYCAPNTPIPCELLEKAGGLETGACDEALGVLTGLGLLEMEDAEAGPLIHPLLAEYARHREGAAELLPALSDALGRLATEANAMDLPALLVPLRVHLETVATSAQGAQLEVAGLLWNELGYHLQMVADYAGARAAYERALMIDEEVFGLDNPNVAMRVNNLGTVLQELGDLAGARAAIERGLAITVKLYGPNHPAVARAVNNLGSVLQALGDLPSARAAYERALAIDEKVYGPDHPSVAVRVNNLGSVLQALGDLAGARAAFERALAINEEVYGPDHPKVARDVNNLGGALRALGDLAGARAAIERALAIDERVYGPDHPEVAADVNNLGSVLQDLGDPAGARAAIERALAIFEKVLGPEHPNVATLLNNLGSVLKDLGDLAGARAAYERALAILEKVLAPEHPMVAALVSNLGLVLQALGDLTGARAAYERALEIDDRMYGPDHPRVAIRVNNLGLVLQALGDLAGARAACERALAIDEKVYGPDHSNVAIRVSNMGTVLKELGDLAGARAAYERALAIFENVLGPDHPNVATLVNNLGGVLHVLGDLTGARAAYERALAIDEKVYGPDHPSVARDVSNLGRVLQDLGDLAGAQAAYERALEILERFLPPDHPKIRIVRGNLKRLIKTE